MDDRVGEYLLVLENLRSLKARGVDLWETMSKPEHLLAIKGERDSYLALADKAEADGDGFTARWHRRDADKCQERLDELTRTKCHECGQALPSPVSQDKEGAT